MIKIKYFFKTNTAASHLLNIYRLIRYAKSGIIYKDLKDFFKSATKTPNPKTKAINRKFDTDDEMTDAGMENKGDFNISNLHKDTKISLEKKKASNKKRSNAERALEAKEDAEGK